jgi:hypothetical protein
LFYEEIDRLKDLINQMANSGLEVKVPVIQTGPSTTEMGEIKEAIRKVAELEDKFKGMNIEPLVKQINGMKDEINKKADKAFVD